MKRTGYMVLCALLVTGSALSGFGQAKTPQYKTQAEYDAYMAIYNQTDAVKKAAAGEKFLVDFKESDFIVNSHRMIIGAYGKAQNWAKVMEASDRAAAIPGADDQLKAFAYGQAMIAAQGMNNIDKVISYGDKVLALAPNDIDTIMTVSAMIPLKLPTGGAEKTAALDKANGLATKGLTILQPLAAKATADQKPALVQAESQLHATLGLVAYNRPDYKKSIEEYDLAVKGNPKDDLAHYYLGADYSALTAQASKDYQVAFKAWNDAKVSKAEQPVIDDADAKQQSLGADVVSYRDKAMEQFAIAVGIGGPLADQAKAELTKLWMSKNNDTNGMTEFIAQKKLP